MKAHPVLITHAERSRFRPRIDRRSTSTEAGATLDLVRHITALNTAPGRRVHYSVGFDCDERARAAIHRVPVGLEAVSDIEGNPRDLAEAVELTGLLREHPHGDRWPADMRIVCRRERPHGGGTTVLVRGR
jgi:hypothetical protein